MSPPIGSAGHLPTFGIAPDSQVYGFQANTSDGDSDELISDFFEGGMEYSHMQSESKVTFQQEDSTQDRQHFAGYNHTQAIDGRDSFADTGSEFSGSQLPGESVSRTSSFTCNGEDGTRTPMTLSEAFDLLFEVYSDGYLNRDIPIRTRASPIYPSQPQFYLYSSDQCKATKETGFAVSPGEKERLEKIGKEIQRMIKEQDALKKKMKKVGAKLTAGQFGDKKRRLDDIGLSKMAQYMLPNNEKKISVKFQSFNEKNSEVWWSENHDQLFGVVARAMSKTARAPRYSGESSCLPQDDLPVSNRRHGYAGRMFSLVYRSENIRDKGGNYKNIRSLIVPYVPSLVHFWPVESKRSNTSARSHSICRSSSKSNADKPGTNPMLKVEDSNHGYNSQVEYINKTIRIRGDLIVDGNITGKLVTPPGAADYAEWFPQFDPKEKILPGMVVQLRSPEQKITLDTSNKGPHMVVSSTPSIAAGVPLDLKAALSGALCAFLGQVPVRVKGPVACGDFLFPSHDNDGFAISHRKQDHLYKHLVNHADVENEPLGTAMESCPEGEHTILSFVRWQHNIKYQVQNAKTTNLKSSMLFIWLNFFWKVVDNVVMFAYLYPRPHLQFERYMAIGSVCIIVFVAFHFPEYYQFVERYDIIPLTLFQLTRMGCGFYKMCSCLSTVSLNENVKDGGDSLTAIDLFVSIMLVCGSVITLILYAQLAHRYFTLSHRPNNLIWKLVHSLQDGFQKKLVKHYDPHEKHWTEDPKAYENILTRNERKKLK